VEVRWGGPGSTGKGRERAKGWAMVRQDWHSGAEAGERLNGGRGSVMDFPTSALILYRARGGGGGGNL
jgi:hypothetical protein